jgi:hypothetical protein
LIAGRGLSRLLDDRGVFELERSFNLGIRGDSNKDVLLMFELLREWFADALDGLSTGNVLDLIRGPGPREKFCVPSN